MATGRYVLRDTGRLFFRHWGLSLLTLLTAASVFFLVGGSALLALNVRKVAENIQTNLVIQAYVATESGVNTVIDQLKDDGDIAELRYISPQEGLERLRSKMGSQPQALTLLSENPLPWTIEITVRQASFVAPTVRKLSAISEIDDLMYSGSLADRLIEISSLISNVVICVLIIAILVCGVVLYNTVRIGLYSRRQEIAVMLLVGSTRSNVASPFVLHGMLLGFFGAVIAAVLLHYGQFYVMSTLDSVLPFLRQQLQWSEIMLLNAILICAGVTMGWLCSFVVVRRYIKAADTPH